MFKSGWFSWQLCGSSVCVFHALIPLAYDKIYGEGAWKNHLKEHNAIMQENAEVEGEFWEYLEDLSSKELPK